MNDEEEELANDMAWADRGGDVLIVERGYPLADVVEEDDEGGQQ